MNRVYPTGVPDAGDRNAVIGLASTPLSLPSLAVEIKSELSIVPIHTSDTSSSCNDDTTEEVNFIIDYDTILGTGSYGKVYAATRCSPYTICAVKIVKDCYAGDHSECILHRRLCHNHIAALLSYWHRDEKTFMAIEYCGDGNMRNFLNNDYRSYNIRAKNARDRQYFHLSAFGCRGLHT